MRPSRRNFSDAVLRFVTLTADAYIDLLPTQRELIRPLKHPNQKDFRISWMLSLTTTLLSRGMGGVANNLSCHRFTASPPRRMPTTHAETINADLLAFIGGRAAGAAPVAPAAAAAPAR
jgi:hypothetical protein